MKKIVILLAIIFAAIVCAGQTPYKIQNKFLNQVWMGDTNKTYIYGDSIVMNGTEHLFLKYPNVRLPLVNGTALDTLLLFVDGATGIIDTVPIGLVRTGSIPTNDWHITGNAGTDEAVNFIGTTDTMNFRFRVYNQNAGFISEDDYRSIAMGLHSQDSIYKYKYRASTSFGYYALSRTIVGSNSAFGAGALDNDSTGILNTAVGESALQALISGNSNTAVGSASLIGCISDSNTALGFESLGGLYNGNNCIGIGNKSLRYISRLNNLLAINSLDRKDSLGDLHKSIILGVQNIDSSLQQLLFNSNVHIGAFNEGYWLPFIDGNASDVLTTDGAGNVSWQPAGGTGFDTTKCHTFLQDSSFACGNVKNWEANNTDGTYFGYNAGKSSIHGVNTKTNVGMGIGALYSNTSGYNNVAIGYQSLYNNSVGNRNTALGHYSLYNVTGGDNVGVGYSANISLVSGIANVTMGSYSSYNNTSSFNTCIGYSANYTSTNKSHIISLGAYAGYYSNLSDKLFINSYDLSNVAGDTSNSIVYGHMTGTAATQRIRFNVGNAITPGKFVEYEPDHAYFTYKNTGYTVLIATASTWTDATDSLNVRLTDAESDGFTFDNDTMVYNGYASGHIKFDVVITVRGDNNVDWELQVYNITDGTEVSVGQICSTTGTANYISMPLVCYDKNADPGDRYILRIRNLTNTTDPVIYRVMWYADVIHYK